MATIKLFVFGCVLCIGYFLYRYFYRKGRLVIGETENYPVLSRVRGSKTRPNFLHYIHRGHRNRPRVVNRADRRSWFQDAV